MFTVADALLRERETDRIRKASSTRVIKCSYQGKSFLTESSIKNTVCVMGMSYTSAIKGRLQIQLHIIDLPCPFISMHSTSSF